MPMRGLENHIVIAGNVLPPPPYSQHMQTAIGTRAHPSALVGTHFRVAILPSRSVPAPRPPLPLPHSRGAAVMRMTIDNIERDSYHLVHTRRIDAPASVCTLTHIEYSIRWMQLCSSICIHHPAPIKSRTVNYTAALVCVTIAHLVAAARASRH